MRTVFGQSLAGATRTDGQSSVSSEILQDNQGRPPAKPVRHINGERISFKQLAQMAWPQKTESHLAFVTKYDARTCRRWLADDTEPPAVALAIVLAEIMRRAHQR